MWNVHDIVSYLIPSRSKSIEWTDTQLYIEVLGRVATRAGLAVACDSADDGLLTMVSGVPKVFEAFIMMCVSD